MARGDPRQRGRQDPRGRPSRRSSGPRRRSRFPTRSPRTRPPRRSCRRTRSRRTRSRRTKARSTTRRPRSRRVRTPPRMPRTRRRLCSRAGGDDRGPDDTACWWGMSNGLRVGARAAPPMWCHRFLGRVVTVVVEGVSSRDNLACLQRAARHYIPGERVRRWQPARRRSAVPPRPLPAGPRQPAGEGGEAGPDTGSAVDHLSQP